MGMSFIFLLPMGVGHSFYNRNCLKCTSIVFTLLEQLTRHFVHIKPTLLQLIQTLLNHYPRGNG